MELTLDQAHGAFSYPDGITPDLILQELRRITASRAFRRASRLRSILEYVVAIALDGDAPSELEAARHLFGKDKDFDPSLDPVVRVQFGRLRKALSRYFQTEGATDPVTIEIPLRSYKPAFHRARPQQSAAAHAGTVLEMPLPEHHSIEGIAPKNLSPEELEALDHPGIAVLPFANLTNDPEQDAFCYGLTEEISNELASRNTLAVVASSSTFQFKDERTDVRTAGRELGVPLILEGSVRIEKGNTRVVVQLARSEDGVALWSDSFDSKMHGSLNTQKSLARKVMESLPIGA